MAEEYLTPKQAAEELGISRARMYQIIASGHIPYKRLYPGQCFNSEGTAQKFLISRNDFETYKNNRRNLSTVPHTKRKPVYKDTVVEWQKEHPYSSRYACSKALGIQYQTVRKYWNMTTDTADTDAHRQESQDNQRTIEP